MKPYDYDEAIETLSVLTNALGTGLAVWGVVGLLDAYSEEAEQKETAELIQNRIVELDGRLKRLDMDRAAGKISVSRYARLYADYEAEQSGLIETLDAMREEIDAQKKQGLRQIMGGAGIAALAPLVGDLDSFPDIAEMLAYPFAPDGDAAAE